MLDLFGNDTEVIRTLGLYQPFGSLMLHGKIETRQVAAGKKPPFPVGKYLLYTTKEPAAPWLLWNWCGPELMSTIEEKLKDEPTKDLHGHAIAIGTLRMTYRMRPEDEASCFIKLQPFVDKITWCLLFSSISRIEPFPFVDDNGHSMGSQGVSFLNPTYKDRIKII